jgi:hypothetical protein
LCSFLHQVNASRYDTTDSNAAARNQKRESTGLKTRHYNGKEKAPG